MLSPEEAATRQRGQDLHRVMRAAAAMAGIFEDIEIADAVGVHRNTVAGWWKGATPAPDVLRRFATATGVSLADLSAFVYYDGPAPVVDWPTGEAERAPQPPLSAQQLAEAQRWQDQRADRRGSDDNRRPRSTRPRRTTEG